MIPLSRFLAFILLALAISIPCVNSREENPLSVYDVLKKYGLPIGLLPNGVKDFVIDDTGRFEVHLDQACNAKFESELHYDKNVSGSLSFGQIGGLSGISAQELFLWFPVKGIRVDVPSSGLIYFDVGVASKQFSLSLFEKPRDCMAVRDDQRQDIETGKVIAEAVFKSQIGELRYQLDQQNFGRNIL